MGVRSESVRLSLEDAGFSSGMARAAAAAALLDTQLDRLDGNNIDLDRSMRVSTTSVDRFGTQSALTSREVDRLSGRMRIFADVAAVLGPSLVPIGAVAVPAIAGLASQFGFAAAAGASAIFTFQGVGTALEAVNAAAIEPTAANLQAAREAMQQLSPAGQDMVRQLQSMRPLVQGLRDAGQEAMFPGLIEGFESLERLAPQVESILTNVSATVGDLFADGAESLAGDRWADFFQMLATEARPTLTDMASAIGSFSHGMSELWEAFMPLNRDFGSWLADSARSFDQWAEGLSQTNGFQEFVDYIRDVGPQVADTFAALGRAVVEVVEAVAPLGGPSLKIIETFANALATIADSDFGTPLLGGIAALALYNRTLQTTAALQARMGITAAGGGGLFAGLIGGQATVGRTRAALQGVRTDLSNMAAVYGTAGARTTRETARLAAASKSLRTNLAGVAKGAGPAAAAIAAFGVASADTESDIVGMNLATGSLIGLMAGRGALGVGIGAVVGNLLDMRAAYQETQTTISDGDMTDAMDAFNERMETASSWTSIFTGEASRLGAQDLWSWATTGETQTMKLAKAAGAWQSTGESLTEWLRRHGLTMSDVTNRTGTMTDAIRSNERALLRQRSATEASREAMRAAGEGFLDYSDAVVEGKFSLDAYLDALEKQLRAQANFDRNLNTLRGRGVKSSVLDALIEQGPAAARAVEHLANATDAELRRFVRSVNAGSAGVRNFGRDTVRELGKASNAFNSLPRDVQTEISAKGIPQTEAQVNHLVEKYKLTEKQRQALVTLKDLASGQIQQVLGLLDRANGYHASSTITITTIRRTQYEVSGGGNAPGDTSGGAPDIRTGSADGGTVPKTGLGYADRHPYLLADGEEVISNRFGQADRHRALLKAINANRLADGGTARVRMRSGSSSGVMRHVFEHRVTVTGALDARRAVAELQQEMHTVSQANYEQNRDFERTQR